MIFNDIVTLPHLKTTINFFILYSTYTINRSILLSMGEVSKRLRWLFPTFYRIRIVYILTVYSIGVG